MHIAEMSIAAKLIITTNHCDCLSTTHIRLWHRPLIAQRDQWMATRMSDRPIAQRDWPITNYILGISLWKWMTQVAQRIKDGQRSGFDRWIRIGGLTTVRRRI